MPRAPHGVRLMMHIANAIRACAGYAFVSLRNIRPAGLTPRGLVRPRPVHPWHRFGTKTGCAALMYRGRWCPKVAHAGFLRSSQTAISQ